MRRSAIRRDWLFAISLIAAACNRTPAGRFVQPSIPTGQTVRVAGFPDYLNKSVVESFQTKTSNQVIVETYRTNEELSERLAKGVRYDLVFPSSYVAEQLISRGLLQPMVRERVPNLVNVPVQFRNPPYDPSMQYCIPYAWSLLGLGVISQREVRGRDPDRWSELFSLKPRGQEAPTQVVMLDDMRATIGVTLRSLGYSASTRSREELMAAQQLLLAQLPRVQNYVEDPAVPISKNQVPLALSWSTEIFDLMRHRSDVRFVLPREGTLLYVDHGCVLKGAEHPEVAFALLNHLLDPFSAAETTNANMLATANQEGRRMLDIEARWMWGMFESVTARAGTYEILRDVGPAQPLYDDVWRTVKAALAAQNAQNAKAAAPAGP